MDLREKFDAVMSAVMRARNALLDATEAEIEAREALKSREMALLAMPADQTPITGKNAETRMAQLRELTATERESLTRAEGVKRLAALKLELALDARRNLESILKIEELEK
jgi:hypothetical protein